MCVCVCGISTCTWLRENFIISDWLRDVSAGRLQNSVFLIVWIYCDAEIVFMCICVCFPLSGAYIPMDMNELPPFWLAYLSDPSDSGRIHSNIRQRWLSGTSPNQTLFFWRQELSNGLRCRRYRCSADESYWWWWSHCFLLYWCSVVICCISPVSVLFHHQLRMSESS